MGVAGVIVFMLVLILAVVLTLCFAVRGSGEEVERSKGVLNMFEPDNTAPKMTELIDFHKQKGNVKYNVGSAKDGANN